MASEMIIDSFSIVDYSVFFVMLIGSLGIGVYHCICSNKTTEDFLLASRSMSPVPVVLSLIATYISSIAILGLVGEVYGHGIQLAWSLVGLFIGMTIAIFVFMPIIYPLKLSSINEYLELRFRSPVLKRFVLLLSTASLMLYLGICLYAPTLALEAVTPFKSSTYVLILGIAVTIYSSLGGLKAVMWTDAFQSVVIVLGVLIANVSAITTVGGLGEVWRIASEHGRTDALNFGFGVYERHTVFNTVMLFLVSNVFLNSFSQSTLQRMGTMPDFRRVKRIFYLNCFGLITIMLLLYLTGLSVFAVYADCDPISMGYINSKDQILPYYVMNYMGYMKGIPGAFVACLFSGAMSSISSIVNALSAMLWADFISQISFFAKAPEQIKTLTNKIISFCLGLIMIALAFMASQMGGLIQATGVVTSVLGGPILGVFLLGTCVPICSKKGAFAGLIFSIVFMTWLVIGSQLHGMKVTLLPLSTDRCENITRFEEPEVFNPALAPQLSVDDNSTHPLYVLYGISYTYIMPLGAFACTAVGVLFTLVAGRQNLADVNPAHVLKCLQSYVGPPSLSQRENEKQTIDASGQGSVKICSIKFISTDKL